MTRSIALLLLMVATATGQAPTVTVPQEVKLQPGRLAKVEAKSEGKTIRWANASPEDLDLIPSESGRWVIVSAIRPGTYRVLAYTAAGDVPSEPAWVVVRVGEVTPPPTPPTPPGPPTPPEPPAPPAPIPLPGLRVLIVYETAEEGSYPAGQRAILYGQQMREYLKTDCIKGKDNLTPEYRIWDKDVDASGAEKHWQDAMKRQRGKLPWLVVSNGKTGFEGPLPESPEKAIDLIRKIAEGGAK